MINTLRTTTVLSTLMLFIATATWLPAAQAGMLGTGSADTQNHAELSADPIDAFLSQDKVKQQLVSLGVDPVIAQERVASLTPQERKLIEEKIDELPAGAGALEVIGIVFLVLLILELVGVTDIFKKI